MRKISAIILIFLVFLSVLSYPTVYAISYLDNVAITYVNSSMTVNSVTISEHSFSASLTTTSSGTTGFYIGYFYDQHPWVDPPYQTYGPTISGGDIFRSLTLSISSFSSSSNWVRVSIVDAFWRGHDYAQQYPDGTWYLHTETDVFDVSYPDTSDRSVLGYNVMHWTENVRIMQFDSLSVGQTKRYTQDCLLWDRATYSDQNWIPQSEGYVQCIFVAIEVNGGSTSINLSGTDFRVFRGSSVVKTGRGGLTTTGSGVTASITDTKAYKVVLSDNDMEIQSISVYLHGTGYFQLAIYNDTGGNDVGTVLLLPMDGSLGSTTFNDIAAGHKTVTSYGGASIDTAYSKFGGASGKFIASSSQYLSLADSTDWVFSTLNITIDFWVRFNSLPSAGNYMHIYDQYQDVNNRDLLAIKNVSNLYYWDFSWCIAGSWYGITTSTSVTVSTGTWYHVAMTRSSGVFRFFQDGVQVGSEYSGASSIAIPDYSGTVSVGSRGDGSFYLDGWLEELRVSKGVARWVDNFVSPTAPYGAPLSKLLSCPNTSASSGVWNTISISACSPSSLTLDSGTYWFAWQWNSTNIGFSQTSGLVGDGYYMSQTYGTFPSTWLTTGYAISDKWSMYTSYTNNILSEPFIESSSLTDSLSRKFTGKRTFSDYQFMSELLSRTLTSQRAITETSIISESISRLASLRKTLTDSQSLSESISRFYGANRILTEQTGFSESLSKGLGKFLQDIFSIWEEAVGVKGGGQNFPRSLTEYMDVAEQLSRSTILSKTLSESTAMSESLLRQVASLKPLTETILSSEQLSKRFTGQRTLSDLENLSVILQMQMGISKLLQDSSATSETLSRQLALQRPLISIQAFIDLIERQAPPQHYERNLYETLILIESLITATVNAQPVSGGGGVPVLHVSEAVLQYATTADFKIIAVATAFAITIAILYWKGYIRIERETESE